MSENPSAAVPRTAGLEMWEALGACAPGRRAQPGAHEGGALFIVRPAVRGTAALGVLLILVSFLLGGCSTYKEGSAEARPIVVIGGWADPGLAAKFTSKGLRKRLGDDRPILGVSPGFARSFDRAATQVIEAVEEQFGKDAEVDVVAVSMGGLVARHAATFKNGSRLNVHTLYTLGTPHGGASLADRFGFFDFFGAGRQMRSGSAFLGTLTRRERVAPACRQYNLVAYSRDQDRTIGETGLMVPDHLAPRAVEIRLPVPFWQSGHSGIFGDNRILDDIARRMTHD